MSEVSSLAVAPWFALSFEARSLVGFGTSRFAVVFANDRFFVLSAFLRMVI